jgi:hypothetical protein
VKISIEGREFELTDECIADVLRQMREVLTKTNVKLPSDIQAALDRVNSLTDESLLHFVQAIRDYGLGYYHGLSTPKRLSVMTGVRWLITQIEKKVGEAGKIFRPPKKADPLEHLVNTLYPSVERTVPTLGKVLPYATITLSADNTHVTNIRFSLEGQSGGQVAPDGNVRERENHSGETARQEYSTALSRDTALYSGYKA